MVKITRLEHLEQVPEKEIVPYIKNLLEHILEEYKDYCANGSLETIGAIYYIDSKSDLNNHLEFGLSIPIDKSRFEFCLDYDKAKTFQYSKLRYNPNYRVVIFGPVPHSSTGKNDSSSVIAEMKNHEGYPFGHAFCGRKCRPVCFHGVFCHGHSVYGADGLVSGTN